MRTQDLLSGNKVNYHLVTPIHLFFNNNLIYLTPIYIDLRRFNVMKENVVNRSRTHALKVIINFVYQPATSYYFTCFYMKENIIIFLIKLVLVNNLKKIATDRIRTQSLLFGNKINYRITTPILLVLDYFLTI